MTVPSTYIDLNLQFDSPNNQSKLFNIVSIFICTCKLNFTFI